ncbi:CASP-like protein 5A2 isoform X2 [Salvia divinorum]|uniref:CASP-like protein n=1 Tax=Salvia divinorum TaxID=28513 RepID=A0ABD1GJ35_SALDI
MAFRISSPNCGNNYLVAATGLQSIWSIVLGITDAYALLVGRRLQNPRAVRLFAVSDGVTSNLTFAAACASAGITVLIGNDLGSCGKNHCTEFETATAMAFLSWFAALPSFLLNFWSVASR